MKRLILSALLCLGVGVSAWIALAGEADKRKSSQSEASLSTQPQGIGALGRIEPRSRVVRLSHDQGPEGALIKSLLVEEGQDVQQGDIIVVFSDHERRQSEIEITKARLDAITIRKDAARAELTDADRDLKRYAALLKTAATSQAMYDAAKARRDKAQSDYSAIDFDISAAQADWKLAQQKLEQSYVKAPFSGTILKIYAWPGERVSDRAIADLADLTQLDVVAEIYENDIPRLAIGQKAYVTLPGVAQVYDAELRETGFLVQKNDQNNTDPLADRDNRVVECRLTLLGGAPAALRNQIYRQVQVQIQP